MASTGQATPTRKNSGRLMAMNSSTAVSRRVNQVPTNWPRKLTERMNGTASASRSSSCVVGREAVDARQDDEVERGARQRQQQMRERLPEHRGGAAAAPPRAAAALLEGDAAQRRRRP